MSVTTSKHHMVVRYTCDTCETLHAEYGEGACSFLSCKGQLEVTVVAKASDLDSLVAN